ncbi:MAG TPA: hypothetical protein DEB31_09970 [Clostridiales bacterium]|nr:hypothetical protein [Clostridiales bacterium]
MIAVLAVALIFGSASIAFAAEGTEVSVANEGLMQVLFSAREPSGEIISEQPFKVKNPNGVPVTCEYGVITNNQYMKIGNVAVGANAEQVVTISDPGLVGITAYVGIVDAAGQMTMNPYTITGSKSYWLYVKHIDQKTGKVLLVEDNMYFANESIYAKGTAVSSKDSIVVGSEVYLPVAAETRRHFFNGNASLAERTMIFEYAKDVKEDYNVTVAYMNGNAVIKKETVTVPAPNGQVSLFPTETSFTLDGRDYTLQAGQAAQTHRYGDVVREYTFFYDVSAEAPKTAYYISVRYKDVATGAIIAKKNVSVAVGKTVSVDLPEQYAAGNGKTYAKASAEASFTHAHKDYYKGTTYDFLYREVKTAQEPYNIKIVYADAGTGSTLNSITKYIEKNGSATEEIPSTLTVNGAVYYLASGQATKITHNFTDAAREYKVYYNRKGAEEVKPYSITVRLRNNDTNAVIDTLKGDVTIQNGAAVVIPQETLTLRGVRYQVSKSSIKSDGGAEDNGLLERQANGSLVLRHQFSDTRRTYDIFFNELGKANPSDPDDTIQVVVGETTYIDQYLGGDGVEVIDGDEAVVEADEEEPQVPDEEEQDLLDIDENETPGDGLADEEQPEELLQIDENETPGAASPFRNEDGSLKWGWIILDAALLGIAAALIIILAKKNSEKKRQNEAAH